MPAALQRWEARSLPTPTAPQPASPAGAAPGEERGSRGEVGPSGGQAPPPSSAAAGFAALRQEPREVFAGDGAGGAGGAAEASRPAVGSASLPNNDGRSLSRGRVVWKEDVM